MIRKLLAGLIVCCFLATTALAQEETPKNWFNSDANGPYPGMSVDAAHDYLAGKTGQEVIVAIIDSGVDIEHEDLQSIIWTNEDEIPGNGIDDDNNGYVDDVHGWNFIGGADGDNINYENLEIVRLYNKYQQRFGTLDPAGMSKAERAEYAVYQEYKTEIEEKREELAQIGRASCRERV
jgi:cell wall-associated protease